MKTSEWLGNRLQELHFGSIIIGKVTFAFSLVSLVTVISIKFNLKMTPLSLLMVGMFALFFNWFIGYLAEKYGIRRNFQNAQFKDTELLKGNGNAGKN